MALIQLVFAYEDDTYYCNNLMKLRLDQYLQLDLIQNHDYTDVAFITATSNSANVHRCGKNDGVYKMQMLQRNWKKQLTKDLKRDLTDNHSRHAFIFSLRDFCELYSDGTCIQLLTSLTQLGTAVTGTIVLKCSPVIEESRNHLCDARVFGDTNIGAICSCDDRDFFSAIYNRFPETCRFLNTFTKERISVLLLNLIWEFPDRFQGKEQIEATAEFLTHYLNNETMQRRYSLFSRDDQTLIVTHRFKKLYAALQKEDVWKKLQDLISEAMQFRDISSFLRSHNFAKIDSRKMNIFVTHNTDTCFGRFMLTALNPVDLGNDVHCDENNRNIYEICKLINSASRHEEHKEIVSFLESMLQSLSLAVDTQDSESYYRILKVMRFGMDNLYIQEKSESEASILKIINYMQSYIKASQNTTDCKHKYEEYLRAEHEKAEFQQNAFWEANKREAENLYFCYRTRLEGYDGSIEAQIFANWTNQFHMDNWDSVEQAIDTEITNIDRKFAEDKKKAEKAAKQPVSDVKKESQNQESEPEDEILPELKASYGVVPTHIFKKI